MTQLEVLHRSPDEGAKATVLFVHGAWHAAWCWDGWMDRFVDAGYSTHALSLRNHGGSDPCGSLRWMRYSAFVHDIRSVMRTLGDDVILVGHSMGGYLIQKIMESQRLQAAALVAPVPVTGTLRATLRFARRHPIQYLKVLGQARLWPVVATPELAGDVLLSDPEHPDADALCGRIQDESFRTYLDMMFFALPRPGRARRHPPVFVTGGTNDFLFSTKEFAETAAAWGGTFSPVEGAPHNLMLAPGWEDVADSVIAWLDEQVAVT